MTWDGETTALKAQRLIREDRVQDCPATTFFIKGDSKQYLVTIVLGPASGLPFAGTCTCRHGREHGQQLVGTTECSHIQAGALIIERRRGK